MVLFIIIIIIIIIISLLYSFCSHATGLSPESERQKSISKSPELFPEF